MSWDVMGCHGMSWDIETPLGIVPWVLKKSLPWGHCFPNERDNKIMTHLLSHLEFTLISLKFVFGPSDRLLVIECHGMSRDVMQRLQLT